jgi:hypothetical protein
MKDEGLDEVGPIGKAPSTGLVEIDFAPVGQGDAPLFVGAVGPQRHVDGKSQHASGQLAGGQVVETSCRAERRRPFGLGLATLLLVHDMEDFSIEIDQIQLAVGVYANVRDVPPRGQDDVENPVHFAIADDGKQRAVAVVAKHIRAVEAWHGAATIDFAA